MTNLNKLKKITFPILGGRLLKRKRKQSIYIHKLVSNPWREAIEEIRVRKVCVWAFVSNPWREAIEGNVELALLLLIKVSNPWREAIEVGRNSSWRRR